MNSARHLALQGARFGAIGLAATVTHVLMFTSLIVFAALAPLVANFIAFGTAVLVSFIGHFHWTFRNQRPHQRPQQQRTAFARFALVALAGLALNSFAVILVVDLLGLPYQYALILMICVVPLLVFALSKFWAFA